MTRRPNPAPSLHAQRGVALLVVLILLLVMSLMAVLSLRGTLMEERASANMMDRSLSFQAAEAALRQGESLAASKPALPTSGCSAGLCAIPAPTDTPRWKDPTVWAGARSLSVSLGTVTATPQYIVELIADNVPPRGSCTTEENVSPEATCSGSERRYRITARSQAAGRAVVMLQSNYAVP
ncbi:pilus assembly protein PilX [Lysobacter helvus]|uniref:Pilus assembly protein PilX n=2 Tax=Lysobacteraceae TaxID=32033 RepID=A0ABM7Q9J8_9GAMM|nr:MULTISPECIES: PilX N-terminal domain-containing pilus assembly protein [Lysobacter]BCT94111.1 pilus assembly protein PilX [Lysobacter caseinilyticus]BCT97267.1 pilus assembly protein PilX [Lysobacter helvus]